MLKTMILICMDALLLSPVAQEGLVVLVHKHLR